MSRTRIFSIFLILGTTALASLMGACTEDDPCDEGEMLVDGWCQAATADAAPPAPTSDAAVADDTGGAAPAFGQICTTAAECPAPTNYCAVVPPATSGNCTATGCNLDPTICPAGWTCMDLTAYTGQHLCIPPST